MKRNFLFIFFCLFFSFCTGGCNNFIQKEPIELYKITPQPKTKYLGTIKFQHTSYLSFQEDGVISYIPFSKGDFIKKGQIVAKIDDTLYRIRKNEELAILSEKEVQYAQSKNYFNRMNTLHSAGGVSDNDWEDAKFDMRAKSKQISLQKEKIQYINKQLSYTVLTSPYDGYILEKTGEVGEFVTASKVILTIVNSSQTQVEIMVSSDVINDLKLNDEIIVFRNNISYKGKITHISQSSNNSGGYLIKIFLDKFYPDLKEGMNVDVEFLNSNNNSVFVPINSISKENEKNYVYKIENINNNKGTVKKIEVQTGKIVDEKIEIKSNLKQNDIVISKGQNYVKENSKIKI